MSAVFPKDISSLQVLETLSGSSHPQRVKDLTTNHEFVMKRGFNKKHAVNEYRVNLCYSNMGCNVPKMRLYMRGNLVETLTNNIESQLDDQDTENDIVVLSEFISNGVTWSSFQKNHNEKDCDTVRREMGKFFVLDCLFANRDVIGSDDTNILIVVANPNTFQPYRIDNGGALGYRAQGKLKDLGEWSDFVSEVNLMVDSTFNSNTYNMFGRAGAVYPDLILQQTMDIMSMAESCIYPYLTDIDVNIVKERLNYLQTVVGMFDITTSATTSRTGISEEVTTADPELVNTLVDMGFTREKSECALIAACNNLDSAFTFLF